MPFAHPPESPISQAASRLWASSSKLKIDRDELRLALAAMEAAARQATPEEAAEARLPSLLEGALLHPHQADALAPVLAALVESGNFWPAGPWRGAALRAAWAILPASAALTMALSGPEAFSRAHVPGAEPLRGRSPPEPWAWMDQLDLRRRRDLAAGQPPILDQALPALLPLWKASGALRAWGMLCVAKGWAARLAQAAQAGLDLSGCSPAESGLCLLRLCSSDEDPMRPRPHSSTPPPDFAARQASGAACWDAAIRAGMPPASDPAPIESEPDHTRATGGDPAPPRPSPEAVGALRSEAARSGRLPAFALPMLAELHCAHRLAATPGLHFDGATPISWAFSKGGFAPSDFTPAMAMDCLRRHWDLKDPALLLPDLAACGLSWKGVPQRRDDSALSHVVLECALARGSLPAKDPALPEAIHALGVDPFATAGGKGLVEHLMRPQTIVRPLAGPQPPAGRSRAIQAALDLAERARPGGGRALLAIRGKDGSGPLHWAARALDPSAVELFAKLGADPRMPDSKGRSPAHCLAGSEGASASLVETFLALDALGADWSAKDRQGRSALSMLASKARHRQLADILSARPKLLDDPAASSEFFAILAQRGPGALAMAEQAAFSSTAAPASPKGPRRAL